MQHTQSNASSWARLKKIKTRLMGTVLLSFITIGFLGYEGITGLQLTRSHIENLVEQELVQITATAKIQQNLEMARSQALLTLQHDPESPLAVLHGHSVNQHLDTIQASIGEVERLLFVLSRLELNAEELSALANITQGINDLKLNGYTALVTNVRQGEYHQANLVILNEINPRVEQLQDNVEKIIDFSIAEAKSGYEISQTQARDFFVALLMTMIICMAGLTAIAYFTIRRFVIAIEALDSVSNNIAGGRLSSRINIGGEDEFADIAEAVNRIAVRFESTVAMIGNSTSRLSVAAEQNTVVSQQTSANVDNQQSQTQLIASAIEELTATVQDVASNAAEAAAASQQADDVALSGERVVTETIDKNQQLAAHLIDAKEAIGELSQDSKDIGSILDVIRDISDQTNLLALNAAIEAARAGNYGRGFAVVADEVRTLAQRTNDSTEEIQAMIVRLQRGCQNAMVKIEEGNTLAEQSVTHAHQAGDSLKDIRLSVVKINDMNAQIATAAEQQATVTGEINLNVIGINDISVQTSEGAAQTLMASQEIATLTSSLNKEVAVFN